MKRLTDYHFGGSVAYMVCSLACIDDEFDCSFCSKLNEIVDRLAAYEDTGLEPKQAMLISNVLREVGETYNCWFDYVVNCVLENSHLKDLAQAEKDGRLVVLPCKVGDTVYRVLTTHDTAPIVTEIEIKSLSQAIELIGKIGEHKVLSYYLVREEAEAALKKREGQAMRQKDECLMAKYIVHKANTGETVNNCFVLRPDRDAAAVAAIRVYAAVTENRTLAADLIQWVGPEPNDPLTLEELRKMDGEPVWVERINIDRPNKWYLLNLRENVAVNNRGGFVSLTHYGDTWLAYRRNP